jgi:hypothetical protein
MPSRARTSANRRAFAQHDSICAPKPWRRFLWGEASFRRTSRQSQWGHRGFGVSVEAQAVTTLANH